ncbi:MAG TPA: LptF/LptG family permease [Pyrinomonadaceae bacterium]|jgi:LPS export ABC transporter permease LptF/LPS export ABC transporter permease LptG
MNFGSRLIERYIIKAIVPYFFLSLLLLTAILFTQQLSRFGELLVGTGAPLMLATEIALALLPNVLIFTLPIALLTGTIIGFSRMGSDSELIAMRAAGVGTWNLLWPVLLVGAILTGAAFYLNLQESPRAAHALRQTALRAALYKLESPVEPRSFNTEIPGYVVYVRDGDKTRGQWGRVFIYSQEKDGSQRLVTARSGRIDSAAEQSELVLNDAVAAKLPAPSGKSGYVIEHLAQLRIQFNTGRAALLARLQRDEKEPEELDWFSLAAYAENQSGRERLDASTLLHKRLTLSISPLIFALLGVSLGLRVRRGGRGLGVLLSLLVLLAYYLLALFGEQMARAGTVPVPIGAWLSTFAALCLALVLLLARGNSAVWFRKRIGRGKPHSPLQAGWLKRGQGWVNRARLLNFPSLLDLNILRTLSLSFIFSFSALTAIFLIFTLFELWRFVATTDAGARLIMKYLFFLLPFVAVQLTPASLLIAVLATYALMSRRSETIAWWACGQSTYRLILPCLMFASMIAMTLWLVQERLMPEANMRQDTLRSQIRGGLTRVTAKGGKLWLATPESGRLYSYEYDEEQGRLMEPTIYEFDSEGVHLNRIIKGLSGSWTGAEPGYLTLNQAVSIKLQGLQVEEAAQEQMVLSNSESRASFKPAIDKPSQLSAESLSDYIKQIKQRGGSINGLTVALQRKYAEPFSVLVMASIAIPLAFIFGRKHTLAALCVAIATAIIFWAVAGGFQQIGNYGLLPPAVAAWSPLVIFLALGTYMLSRTRT